MKFFLCALFSLLILISFERANGSSTSDLYTISDVRVDITASSALKAKEEAIEKAAKIAFKRLIKRLTNPRDLEKMHPALENEINDQDISELVKDFEITAQKNSAIRFLGTFTYRFSKPAIKSYFSSYGATPSEASPPLVIIPLFEKNHQIMLWDEDNLWHKAWSQKGNFSPLIPLVVPVGDLGDLSKLSAEQAKNLDANAAQKIAVHYGTTGSIIAWLCLDLDNHPTKVNLKLSLLQGSFPAQTETFSLPFTPDAPLKPQMKTFIEHAVQKIETLSKNVSLSGTETSTEAQFSTLTILIPLQRLGQWLSLQETFKRIPLLKQAKLNRMTAQYAQVEVQTSGSYESLQAAFKLVGYGLEVQNTHQGPLIILRPSSTASNR